VVNAQQGIANSIIDYALTGGDAHVATRTVFDGLDWHTAGARVEGSPHTLYELLNHMIFWQDGVLEWLDGRSPSMPEHASDSWPGPSAPSSRAEWLRTVRRFRSGLTRLERAARRVGSARKGGGKSPLEMLAGVAAHNSYHAGQAALLRQLLCDWPPPTGGLTW
jgi:uncharacterized damage-inducible protein DinB